ncbi:MAG: ABC transporter permease [Cyclobacteriaceae bacterium]|nr:ABC transporter permease [Cyclobacteriaceae bacterium]
MLRNYIVIALRNILKYKGYSVINVMGLALGMAIFFLTLSLVYFELSYDRFHTKAEHIYRVHQKFNDGGTTADISFPIKQALVDDYPQIQEATSFAFAGGDRGRVGNRNLFVNGIFFVDTSFFNLFDIPFVKGSKDEAQLKFSTQTNDALITPEEAKNLFGEEDPVGKTFTLLETNQSYTVLGVVSRMPRNSHFNYGVLLPIYNHPRRKEVENNWNNPVVHTYVYIPDEAGAEAFNEKELDNFIKKHFPVAYGGENAHLPVIKMTDIHLNSNLYYELGQNSSVIYVTAVSSVGFLILILASINFMNLTTARSVRRAREVGLRKTLGAHKTSLVAQFLGESIVLSLISIIVGAGLAYLLLPVFNANLDQSLEIDFLSMQSIASLVAISLFIGVLSGIYPAFFLAAYKPVLTLKSSQGPTDRLFVRKGLVIFQFIVVTTLLIGIITLNKQLSYMNNKDMGYNPEGLVYMRSSDKMRQENNNYQSFITEVDNLPGVQYIAGVAGGSYETVQYEGMPVTERKGAIIMNTGPDYALTMGIPLVAGRFPSRDILTDKHTILLNETAVGDYGWTPTDAIGKEVKLYEGDSAYTVIGVLKDFHMEPLTVRIQAIGFVTTMLNNFGYTALRLTGENRKETEEAIMTAWKRYDDGWPFEIWHETDGRENQNSEFRKLGTMMQELTYVGIFIACIGLFGLATFSAERRTKEIGVRKVHGASVGSIWKLMVVEFANIVILASLVGVAAGYYEVKLILQNFAYRTEVGLEVYALAVIAAISIAVITVSYQAIKSAKSNPVNSLRAE